MDFGRTAHVINTMAFEGVLNYYDMQMAAKIPPANMPPLASSQGTNPPPQRPPAKIPPLASSRGTMPPQQPLEISGGGYPPPQKAPPDPRPVYSMEHRECKQTWCEEKKKRKKRKLTTDGGTGSWSLPKAIEARCGLSRNDYFVCESCNEELFGIDRSVRKICSECEEIIGIVKTPIAGLDFCHTFPEYGTKAWRKLVSVFRELDDLLGTMPHADTLYATWVMGEGRIYEKAGNRTAEKAGPATDSAAAAQAPLASSQGTRPPQQPLEISGAEM